MQRPWGGGLCLRSSVEASVALSVADWSGMSWEAVGEGGWGSVGGRGI